MQYGRLELAAQNSRRSGSCAVHCFDRKSVVHYQHVKQRLTQLHTFVIYNEAPCNLLLEVPSNEYGSTKDSPRRSQVAELVKVDHDGFDQSCPCVFKL